MTTYLAFAAFVLLILFFAALSRPRAWLLATGVAGFATYGAFEAGLLGQAWGFMFAAVTALAGTVLSALGVRGRAQPDEPERQRPQAPAARAQGADGSPTPMPRLKPERGTGFAGVAGMAELKAKIKEAADEAVRRGSQQQRNGILLHGAPGNGKTFLGEALAQELRVPLVTMTMGDVGSRWIGATAENAMRRFRIAKDNAPCVLFLDEADSLLGRRNGGDDIGSGARDQNATTNTLLTEMVKLRGTGVVLVAATNFIEALDTAAIREGRFDFKIEVTPPDEPARLSLLDNGLKRHAKGIDVPRQVVASAARRWRGFSVKRLLAVTEQAPVYARRTGKSTFALADMMAVLREVQGSKRMPPEGTKRLDELVLPADLRASLTALAVRLQHSFEIEEAGGTVPTGLLFSGPPGTGKTETAKTLARESGYAFIATAGNDLITDPQKIDRIHADAMDMRPAIVFIDEADDLLAERASSPFRSATNKLLTVMDGAGIGRIPDVLYIAATNHPDAIDRAALRGGRFTEKLEFAPPDAEAMTPWIENWLRKKGWQCDIASHDIAAMLDGQPMANAIEVLQQAVNAAITESSNFETRRITAAHVERAARTVLA